MPVDVSSLPVEFLFSVHALVGKPVVIPGGPAGTRVVVAITGGTFEGPKAKGTVEMGGDWLTMRPAVSAHLDVRILLTTGDGASIHMAYEGIMAPGEEGPRIIAAPLFQTGDERYAWLNDVQAISIGKPGTGCVDYEVYRVI